MTSLVTQTVKVSAYNVGDLGSIPGLWRSSGEGNGKPLQYSWLENPMDRGAWWAIAHGVAKSRTQLSDFTFTSTQFKAASSVKPFLFPSVGFVVTFCMYLQHSVSIAPGPLNIAHCNYLITDLPSPTDYKLLEGRCHLY